MHLVIIFPLFFLLASFILAVYGAKNPPLGILLWWPSLSFFLVGIAYALRRPGILGKKSDGTFGPGALLLVGPYLALSWTIWRVLVLLSREEATARLTPNVRIGRRLLPGELPDEIEVVVDLTSELPATPIRRADVKYLSYPILDATAPDTDRLVELVADLGKKCQTQLYVHCAQGHGRTGLVAALLLIAGGKAGSFAEAMEEVRCCRPGVAVNKEQRTVGEKAARLLCSAARRPPHDTCNQDHDSRARFF